ncbi:hypothetical protein Droror1_Dr00027745 [Drosera rotundifolia]
MRSTISAVVQVKPRQLNCELEACVVDDSSLLEHNFPDALLYVLGSPILVSGVSLKGIAAAFLLGSSLADALIARVPSKQLGNLLENWMETSAAEARRMTWCDIRDFKVSYNVSNISSV